MTSTACGTPRRTAREHARGWPRSRGFTLVEVLVTLVILAVIAAVVYPLVTQQTERADPVRAAGDLARAGNAVRYFHLNTFAYPGDLEDLMHRPDGADRKINGDPYSSAQRAAWAGPYIDQALAEGGEMTGNAIESGYNVYLRYKLICYDPASNDLAVCAAGTWVAIRVDNVLTSEFEAINDIIDGEKEDDHTFDANGRTESRDKGRIRMMHDPVLDPASQVNRMAYLITPYTT